MLLVAGFLASVAAVAANTSPSGPLPSDQTGVPQSSQGRLTTSQPLNPTELLAVKSLGAAVLGAKAHAVEDPDVVALQQQLTSLRKAVEEALVLRPGPLVVASGQASIKQAAGADSVAQTGSLITSGAGENIRPALMMLHKAAARLQIRPSGAVSPTLLTRRTTLAATTASLEAAANSALAASGSDRYRRLADLARRLQVRSLSEEIEARQEHPLAAILTKPAAASTPTITTLTQHR
jgi:hypothetical protein